MSKGGGNSNTKLRNTLSGNTKSGYSLSISPNEETDEQNDGQADEIRKALLKQIDFDWIAETHPGDVPAANSLINCMVEMMSIPFTKIHGVKQSRYALQKRFQSVKEDDITGFLDHMRGTSVKDIKNINAYWKSAFVTYLFDQDFAVSTV